MCEGGREKERGDGEREKSERKRKRRRGCKNRRERERQRDGGRNMNRLFLTNLFIQKFYKFTRFLKRWPQQQKRE